MPTEQLRPGRSTTNAPSLGWLAAFAPLALLFALACGGDKPAAVPTRDSQQAVADFPVAPSPTVVAPAAAVAEPTPEPPPAIAHRTDCNAIRGTDYTSGEERQWFIDNCGGGSGSGAGGPVASAAGAVPIGPQTPTGERIVIAKAGVNAEVYRAAVPAGGQMPDPVGYFNAVSYDFSRLPGFGGDANSGNLVLSGHVDCARCRNGGSGTAVFWGVRNLAVGDTAQFVTANGTTINYVVTSSRSLSPTANWDPIVASGAADMTLITCTGSFSGGAYTLRHVVSLRKA
jgi:hypothetical protein